MICLGNASKSIRLNVGEPIQRLDDIRTVMIMRGRSIEVNYRDFSNQKIGYISSTQRFPRHNAIWTFFVHHDGCGRFRSRFFVPICFLDCFIRSRESRHRRLAKLPALSPPPAPPPVPLELPAVYAYGFVSPLEEPSIGHMVSVCGRYAPPALPVSRVAHLGESVQLSVSLRDDSIDGPVVSPVVADSHIRPAVRIETNRIRYSFRYLRERAGQQDGIASRFPPRMNLIECRSGQPLHDMLTDKLVEERGDIIRRHADEPGEHQLANLLGSAGEGEEVRKRPPRYPRKGRDAEKPVP